MIRCTKKGCTKAVTRRAKPAATPHEQGWRCPSHLPGEVHAAPSE